MKNQIKSYRLETLNHLNNISDFPDSEELQEIMKREWYGTSALYMSDECSERRKYIDYNNDPCEIMRVGGEVRICGHATPPTTMYAGGGPGQIDVYLYTPEQFARVYGKRALELLDL